MLGLLSKIPGLKKVKKELTGKRKKFYQGAALGALAAIAKKKKKKKNGEDEEEGGSLMGGLPDPDTLSKTAGLAKLFGSDPATKENVKFLRKSPSGLNIYKFTYKPGLGPEGVYEGVMSNEIPDEAVLKVSGEFDKVFYSKIDVDFKKVA